MIAGILGKADTASGCHYCQSEVERQVVAGIFNEDFWGHVFLISLPIPILLLLVIAIHVSGEPSDSTEVERTGHDP